MSNTPRIPAADGVSTPDFGSVMAHVPQTTQRFFELYAAFWQSDVVSAEIKEMTRLRNARITDCGY